jgi:glycosyltransferase involved in cell wall biosynthesis
VTRLADVLTIGVPSFNGQLYIRPALESALRQECRVVVSDDASHDSTVAIIQSEYGSKVSLTTHSKNHGIGANFQTLLEACETPLLLLLNQDDTIAADLRPLANRLHHDELTILNGAEVDAAGARNRLIYRRPPYRALVHGVSTALRTENFIRTPSQVLLPVAAARQAGGFTRTAEGQGAEDWLCWARMADDDIPFRLLMRPRVCYRIHESNATHNRHSMLASRASVQVAIGSARAQKRLRLGW